MKPLKVGVIGCGSIAQFRHLPEYKMNQNVQLTAVCDIDEHRVNQVADTYGVRAYTSYKAMIESGEVEAVSVCTSNFLHAPITIAALQAGIHVLCEKPMATSEEEARAMIKASVESGKKLMIAHNQRFVPSHQKARQLIESGQIGKIYSFRTAFGHGGPESWSVEGKEGWFFQKKQAAMGAMGDLGVHKTDLLRYLLGEEITEVGAFVETSAKNFSDVDDNAVCVLKTESGIVGTLAASWAYLGKEDNSTTIYGEKATIRLEDDPTYSLIVHYANGEVVNYKLSKIQSNAEGGQRNSRIVEAFVNSVIHDTEPPISGEEGMRSLAVILAALKSSETKQIVAVK